MAEFVQYFLEKSAWLTTKIFENPLFFIDLWSLVNLWSGFVFFLVFRAARLKRPMIALIVLLLVFEVFEILLAYFDFLVVRPEIIKDQLTDIILGMAGGAGCYGFLTFAGRFRSTRPYAIAAMIACMASTTYSYFWVGFYHYKYNVELYNTPGINVSTLAGWTSGGLLIILLFELFKRKRIWIRLAMTWVIFFLVLLAFEYFFFYMLEVRETSGYPLKPLIFGLIHGTATLHVFYMIAPFIIISLYLFGRWLVRRSINQEVRGNIAVVG